jgi:hypothetical protein
MQAIDLVAGAPSHALDVCLHKVVAHGEDIARLKHSPLIHRDAFHRKTFVARARWHLDGPTARAPDARRYRVELRGELIAHRDQDVGPSLLYQNMVIMVCILPGHV